MSGDHARWDPATQGVARIRVEVVTVDVMSVDVMAALWTRSCEGFLYLVKGSMSDPDIAASIPTGLPLRSGALVICWRQFGTYCWTLPGLGWNDDGTPL